MSDELKPCPFCGSTDIAASYHSPFVVCGNCNAYGPGDADSTSEQAIAAWNRRADDAPVNEKPTPSLKESTEDTPVLTDSRERLEDDLEKLRKKWKEFDGNYMRIYSYVAYSQIIELLDRQAAITKTEIAEDYNLQPDTSSQTVRNGDSYNLDTREQLEADAGELTADYAASGGVCDALYQGIIDLLDRQAAITANETNHNNPYVGLVRGKQWERTEISDYYCGRCGWKVTDHDSYCPECGGALHKASNKPNSQFDVLKTAETAEDATSKNEIHNFDDSREQLEADIHSAIFQWGWDSEWSRNAQRINERVAMLWLDRQAAITERECMTAAGLAATEAPALQAKVDELTAERDELRDELEFEKSENGWARDFLDRMGPKCGTADCPSLVAYVDRLEAERDELRAQLDTMRDVAREFRDERDGLQAALKRERAEWESERDYADQCEKRLNELKVERDQLSRDLTAEHALVRQFEHDNEQLREAIDAMENGQFYAMYRRACEERERMQRVIDTQRESFKKMEADLHALNSGETLNTLRASVAGLKDTVEKQKAEIERLKDENAELNMQVHESS